MNFLEPAIYVPYLQKGSIINKFSYSLNSSPKDGYTESYKESKEN